MLQRPFRRAQRVVDQPLHGRFTVDRPIEIVSRRFVTRVVELRKQCEQFVVAVRLGGIESCQREQHRFFERYPLLARESEVDAVVAAAFGDQRLRAEKRVQRKFEPAFVLDKILFEQGVESVMARVALMAAEIDGPADVNRQVRVDLDQTLRIALVPVVAGPGLVGDVFEAERLVLGQPYI